MLIAYKWPTESVKEIMSWKHWQAQTVDNKRKRYCWHIERSIANYAAPVRSTNASDTSLGKIQCTQNEALSIITGSHKMSSIDHLHSETKMLLVKDHLNILSAKYLVHCPDTDNVCHHITTMDHPPREMKETLFARHNQTVVPLLANTNKASLQTVHTSFVNTAIDNMTENRVLNYWPSPINDKETYLTRRQRATLSQLRSGHCKLLNSYKKRLKQTDSSSCQDCGMDPQDVPHLFNCTLTPPLWHLKIYGTDLLRRYENWAF